MNAEFFTLASIAAVNPSLLAVDLLLVMNRRPRAMLWCVLLGGVGMAIVLGLLDVLVIRSNIIKTQGSLSPGAGLALGLLLLAAAALLLTGRFHKQRESGPSPGRNPKDKSSWTERALREPRPWLAVVVGAVLGLPGAIYLSALHHLGTGKFSTETKVVAVFLFAIIEFALIILPLILLALWPATAATVLRHSQEWLSHHGRQLGAWIALILGTYLTISSFVSLLG